MSGRIRYGRDTPKLALDNLFTTQEERDQANLEKVQMIPLSELHDFEKHPFSVNNDADMEILVDSVKESGITQPVIARPRPAGGYELVSGHRRKRACELTGLTEMPVIVRDYDDDEAIIFMVNSNIQREHILPSEKAKAYQMKLEAIKHQGERTDLTCGQVAHRLKSRDIVAQESGTSEKQIRRFIRLNNLIPELLKMLDDKKLKMTPAVELSYLTEEEQQNVYQYLSAQDCTPSLSQAQKLREMSAQSKVSAEDVLKIFSPPPVLPKEKPRKIVLPVDKISRYFPKNYTNEQIVTQIMKILESQYRAHRKSDRER